MGRRNINTTKSGKYMNPTDQARKEARKKELKKNKRQRMAVRTAVLKGKDPTQLIIEMEKMDQMEYNVEIPPSLSEKVLSDKRKKLRETLDRVMKLYEKENPEYWVEIRRMVADYEKKREALLEYYEAVKHAQAVTVDEIPLPNLDMPPVPQPDPYDGIELPPTAPVDVMVPSVDPLPQSILKKPAPPIELPPAIKVPPGCPPTLPDEISDIDEDDDADYIEDDDVAPGTEAPHKRRKIRFEDDTKVEQNIDAKDRNRDKSDDKANDEDHNRNIESSRPNKSQGLTSLQAKLLKLSGQDVDQFVRETEVLMQEREADKEAGLRERLRNLNDDEQPPKKPETRPNDIPLTDASHVLAAVPTAVPPPLVLTDAAVRPPTMVPAPFNVAPPPGVSALPPPVGVLPTAPPPSLLPFRPPGPRPTMLPPPPLRVRLPPGPPPQNLGSFLPQGLPRLPNVRLPPPVRPPSLLPRAPPPTAVPAPAITGAAPNVLTAAPQLVPRSNRTTASAATATIQARPQIRSLSADVTRFQPTVLRVKREDKKKASKTVTDPKEIRGRAEEIDKKPTKDDAYSQFMREMEDIM
ncbi:WW domain binding protein 11 [Trinorchestia longiramus]|nr:WW domain binding protein 11 [Trinorchestia longiramus]